MALRSENLGFRENLKGPLTNQLNEQRRSQEAAFNGPLQQRIEGFLQTNPQPRGILLSIEGGAITPVVQYVLRERNDPTEETNKTQVIRRPLGESFQALLAAKLALAEKPTDPYWDN